MTNHSDHRLASPSSDTTRKNTHGQGCFSRRHGLRTGYTRLGPDFGGGHRDGHQAQPNPCRMYRLAITALSGEFINKVNLTDVKDLVAFHSRA